MALSWNRQQDSIVLDKNLKKGGFVLKNCLPLPQNPNFMKALAIIIISTTLLACSNPKEEAADSSTTDSSIQNAADAVTTEPAPVIVSDNDGNLLVPGTDGGKASPAATAAGMNPAHGQPGHRCEIAVGAPLNSAPTTTTPASNPVITSSPSPTASPTLPPSASISVPGTVSTPVPAPTPPGMNPPHGQPGHDCAIAVGAPLKK